MYGGAEEDRTPDPKMLAPIIGVLPHKSNTPIHLTPVSHTLLTDPFDYHHPLFSCVLLLWCKK